MYPILFEYKTLQISTYGLMLMIAFLVCNYLLRRYLESINEDPQQGDDIIFYAAFGGIVGSKVYYLIERAVLYSDYSNIDGIMNFFRGIISLDTSLIFLGINQFGSGLVFLGGLIGGMLSVTYYIKKNNLKWLTVADWVAPYLALGHAIGRIGCFLVGDCYGTYCTLPWAVTFTQGLPPSTFESFEYNYPYVFNSEGFQSLYNVGDAIYVHPTQLYESILYTIIFFYLFKIRETNSINGLIILEYLFLAGLSRFLIEFLRLNPSYALGLSGAQFISLFMVIISTYYMYSFRQKA
tara:strand:+ start:189 stop:1070 length:882 start_codon:yes stop_codon:yes gene_type:complete